MIMPLFLGKRGKEGGGREKERERGRERGRERAEGESKGEKEGTVKYNFFV